MSLRSFLPAFLWAVLILILTMMPGKYIPPVHAWDFLHPDKLAHLCVFAVLMVLALHGISKNNDVSVQLLFLSFLLCAGYGLLLEAMQGTLLSDRYFEWQDAAANALGCVLGGILFKSGFRQ